MKKITLDRRLVSILRKRWALFIGCIFLCAIAVAFTVISLNAGNSLKYTIIDFFRTHHVEDANFATQKELTDENIENIENKFQVRIEKNGYFDYSNNGNTLRIFNLPKFINQIEITEGRGFSSNRKELLINKAFANQSNKDIGDNFKINGELYKVVGYFARPDYLSILESSSSTIPKKEFGFAIVNDKSLILRKNRVLYYSVILKNKSKHLKFRRYINRRFLLTSYSAKKNNTRITSPLDQANSVIQMAFLYGPFLLVLLTSFISIIFSKILKDEKKEIGLLSAVGYSRKELTRFYLKLTTLILIIGISIGIVSGVLLTKPVAIFYANLNNLPDLSEGHLWNWHTMVGGASAISFFVLFAVFLVVRKFLSQRVIDMLKPFSVSSRGKLCPILERYHLKNTTKYSIRTLIRNKTRTIVFVLGIFIASAIILVGFIMRVSVLHVINNELEEKSDISYSYYLKQYHFKSNINQDQGEEVSKTILENKRTGEFVEIVGIKDDSRYYDLRNSNNTQLDLQKGFYLSRVAAMIWGVASGDKLELINPMTMETYSIKIAGIVDSNKQKTIYSSRVRANNLLGLSKNAFNVIVADKKLNTTGKEVERVVDSNDFKKSFETIVSPVLSVVNVLVALGVIIGFVVVHMTTIMIVDDNERNISLLKVLGYSSSEVSKMLFNNYKYVVAAVYIVSIPLMLKFCEIAFLEEADAYNMIISAKIDVFSTLLCLMVLGVSYFVAIKITNIKIMKVDMVECLKESRE